MRYFLLFLLLTSCGYRLGRDRDYPTICVPYVQGDVSGFFTNELIYQLSSSCFSYHQNEADVSLKVEILNVCNDQIGYRHDRTDEGALRENVVATESRETITARVSLFSNDKVLWGPKEIETSVDYDYVDQNSPNDLSFKDLQNKTKSVLSYSLGQLESIDSAQEAALKPLYRSLAQKIVDVISAEW